MPTAYDPQALGAKCAECPWKDQTPVPPKRSAHPKLIVLVETPGEREVEQLEPLVGETGIFFNQILTFLGIPREDLHITNTAACRPPHGAKPADYTEAAWCCAPRLARELAEFEGVVPVITAYGNLATRATVGGTVQKNIGPARPQTQLRVREDEGRKLRELKFEVVSSFHPSRALQHREPQFTAAITDLTARAWKAAHGAIPPWSWGELITTETHTDQQVLDALDRLAKAPQLATDVETTRIEGLHNLEVFGRKLYNIGFGSRRFGLAVSTTWYRATPAIREKQMRMLADPELRKHMHWGDFDSRIFSINNLPVRGYFADTGVMHQLTHPRQPHKLKYAAGLEFDNAPLWKDAYHEGIRPPKKEESEDGYDETEETDVHEAGEYLESAERALHEDNRSLYNAQDCIMQDALYDALRERLVEVHNGPAIFEEMMGAWRVGVEMWRSGIMIDLDKTAALRGPILDKFEFEKTACIELAAKAGWEGRFSPHNTNHIAQVFHLLGAQSRRKTDGGAPSYDAEALELMVGVGGPAGEFAKHVLGARTWHKRLQYVKRPPVWSDGRLHPEWAPARADTLRWSCPGFPIQTIPKRSEEGKKLREMFIPEPGLWMMVADYHQEEARLEALFSGEEELMEAFRKGINPYCVVGARLFGGQASDHPKGTASYNCAKIAFLALIYGVSDQVLLEQMRDAGFAKVDILRVMKLRSMFFAGFRSVVRYMDRCAKEARKNDYVECKLSGYRYPYFGQQTDTHTWNFTNQRGGSYFMNHAVVKIQRELGKNEAIRLSVHDEIVLTGPDPKRLAEILLDCMQTTVRFEGREMFFPVELSCAKKGLTYETKDKKTGSMKTVLAETWGTTAPWELVEGTLK